MKKASKTDWKRLSEIDDSAIDTSDIAALDESFSSKLNYARPLISSQ